MPIELMLLPRWFPFHIDKVSYWSRTVLVPLLVVMAQRPRAHNPFGVTVRELFLEPPEEAAQMIAKAMVKHPKKVATKLGNFGELLYAVAPKASDSILNTAYKLFPESQAAKGKGEQAPDKAPTTEAVAFAHLMKGVHW